MSHVTLICPPGADEYPISYGTTNYRAYLRDHLDPDGDRLVNVSHEAAIHFLHKGGFALDQIHIFRSAGNVRMIHRDGAASCSWGGQSFAPDEDGACTLPVEAMAELGNHGFVPWHEDLAPKKAAAPAPAPSATAGKPPKQTTDGGGATKLPEDPKGSAHPDGVAPKPEPDAKPAA